MVKSRLFFILLGLTSLLFSPNLIHTSWAEQSKTTISDVPIGIIIDIVHDFDQTFLFEANFVNESGILLDPQPITNVVLFDPNGSIIFKSTSNKISFSETPIQVGQYIIKINILDNQDFDFTSLLLYTRIETTQNFDSFGGRMINSGLKTVSVGDNSIVEAGNPAKEVTKIIYPSAWYALEDEGKMEGSKLISIVKIPVVALQEEYERNSSKQLEMDSIQFDGKYVDMMTNDELIEKLQSLMTNELETPKNYLDNETVAEDFMKKVNLRFLEIGKIVETLRERGYEFEAQVLSENGLIPSVTISELNLKNSESELSSEEIPSLKMQKKSGVSPLDIVCREGLQKIFKSSDKSPSCVKSNTAEKLIQRGWANP